MARATKERHLVDKVASGNKLVALGNFSRRGYGTGARPGQTHMTAADLVRRAEQVRNFNRFHTRLVGALDEHLLDSPYSLTQARILYELSHRPAMTAADLRRELALDAGYLSRVIAGFEQDRLLVRRPSPDDARASCLELTRHGRAAAKRLDDASRSQVMAMLERLPQARQRQLVDAMATIRTLLVDEHPSWLLRDPRPGDMGWIVHRQGVLYAEEYGWNAEYEALVAEIVARFVRELDSARERCWIAEAGGQVVGSVFVVRQDDATAKLRLLYVDPCVRGLGIGGRLVDECLQFARRVGYRRIALWTNSVLTAARRIYDKAGFTLVEETPHHSFGKDLVGQVLARDL